MEITLENQSITLTQEGVVFPENATKDIVKEAWKRLKYLSRFSAKGDKSCREYYEKKWGFHEALIAEATIITELGFEISAKITDGKEDPVPTTARFVKLFSDLRDRWRVAIQEENIEYLKLALNALRPMVEEWHQINAYLEEAK
jgi:hypothetical protein